MKFTHIYGNFSIGTDNSVYINGSPICIRPIDLSMLHTLLVDAGAPVSRKRIAASTVRPGYGEKSSRSIDISASRLRAALGTEGWRIQSVRGIGYRFDSRQSQE